MRLFIKLPKTLWFAVGTHQQLYMSMKMQPVVIPEPVGVMPIPIWLTQSHGQETRFAKKNTKYTLHKGCIIPCTRYSKVLFFPLELKFTADFQPAAVRLILRNPERYKTILSGWIDEDTQGRYYCYDGR